MTLSKAAITALRRLPPDGSWATLTGSARSVLRPQGISLAVWTRLLTGWVPDSFWKPEFDEGDGRNGRAWVVQEVLSTAPDGTRTSRHRLTPAGMALARHARDGGGAPSQG